MAKVRDIEAAENGEDMGRVLRRTARQGNKQQREQERHEAILARRQDEEINRYLDRLDAGDWI